MSLAACYTQLKHFSLLCSDKWHNDSCVFYLAGFIADSLNSYKPSFILCAAVEFVAAVILLFVICGHRQPLHKQPMLEEVPLGDEFSGDHCKLDDTKSVTELQP